MGQRMKKEALIGQNSRNKQKEKINKKRKCPIKPYSSSAVLLDIYLAYKIYEITKWQ